MFVIIYRAESGAIMFSTSYGVIDESDLEAEIEEALSLQTSGGVVATGDAGPPVVELFVDTLCTNCPPVEEELLRIIRTEKDDNILIDALDLIRDLNLWGKPLRKAIKGLFKEGSNKSVRLAAISTLKNSPCLAPVAMASLKSVLYFSFPAASRNALISSGFNTRIFFSGVPPFFRGRSASASGL